MVKANHLEIKKEINPCSRALDPDKFWICFTLQTLKIHLLYVVIAGTTVFVMDLIFFDFRLLLQDSLLG